MDDKPIGAIWRPVRDLEPEHREFAHDAARQAATRWRTARQGLENPDIDRSSMDIWLRSQRRAFAIETGQIEGLYLLRRGVTETLIAEGFDNVRGAHTVGNIGDDTLKGLLKDQEAALDMMFDHVKDERPLTTSAIKEWHALLTRHQDAATGVDPFGKRVEIPLLKGQWKIRPNNPHRDDGHVHEYCPPEQVQSEMDRFLTFHEGHAGLDLAPETEAAWLHHEFVRIHPFQDGNGRVSRLLMAYAYAKAGEFMPIIPADGKEDYIRALDAADEGNFPAFARYLGGLAAIRSDAAALRAEDVLAGRTHYRHGNGGVTSNGVYRPPEESLEAPVAANAGSPEAEEGMPGISPPELSDPESERQRRETALRLASALTERISPTGRAHWGNLREDIEKRLAEADRRQDVSRDAINERAREIARKRAEADLRVQATKDVEGEMIHEFEAQFQGNPRMPLKQQGPYDDAVRKGMERLADKDIPPVPLEIAAARLEVASEGTADANFARDVARALEFGTVFEAEEIREERAALPAELEKGTEGFMESEKALLLQRLYRSFTATELHDISLGTSSHLDTLRDADARSRASGTLDSLMAVNIPAPVPWNSLNEGLAKSRGIEREDSGTSKSASY